jgi:lipoteichoic acid synthase
MTEPAFPVVAIQRDGWRGAGAEYVRTSLAFFPVVLLIRAYEYIAASRTHSMPSLGFSGWLRMLESDIALTLGLAVIFAVPVLGMSLLSNVGARRTHQTLLVIATIAAVALSQYFSITLVPLGADLFGYSWTDVRNTTLQSRGFSVLSLAPFAVFAIAAWFTTQWARWIPITMRRAAIVAGLAVVVTLFPAILGLAPAAFRSDTAYNVGVNKLAFFGSKSRGYFASKRGAGKGADVALTGFPLMHKVSYGDVLGPHFALGAQKPNFVFIIVEGLGRDFTGVNAQYGGFMPFLDSLAGRSLSFDNFVSTSGRTFGVLPSILGSLPFGETGFMEIGQKMPPHITLITLLKAEGYKSNFFTGTTGHFDNVDRFMERQGTDRFVDQFAFGGSYAKQPAEAGGESWGYPDDALFKRSLEVLGAPTAAPRLDVYLTITTHEPFIPPGVEEYRKRFVQRLAALPVSDGTKAEMKKSSGVFETLLYSDDAIRNFLLAYSKRADYARTVFFITGDHRMIPLSPDNRIARYHVPMVIFSPMLKAPERIASVSSHLDIPISVLALMQKQYGMKVPDSAAWLGSGLDTVQAFRNTHSVALMRTKAQLDEYLDGTKFLSGGELFTIDANMKATPEGSSSELRALTRALERFQAINTFVASGDHLYSGLATRAVAEPVASAATDSALAKLGVQPTYASARALAFAGKRSDARLILRRVVRDAPADNDSRALLGRTYAWDQKYNEARTILTELVRRAPDYADGYAALIDVNIWDGKANAALALANKAVAMYPRDPALVLAKAKALEASGKRDEALATLDALARINPNYADAVPVRARLQKQKR